MTTPTYNVYSAGAKIKAAEFNADNGKTVAAFTSLDTNNFSANGTNIGTIAVNNSVSLATLSSVILSRMLPIGVILPFADVTFIDGNYWVLCDGAAYPGGGALVGNTPNLNGGTGAYIKGNAAYNATIQGVEDHTHTGTTGIGNGFASPITIYGTDLAQNHTHGFTAPAIGDDPIKYIQAPYYIKYK